jgi:drug/metabolite transporter (DMT)-like permease
MTPARRAHVALAASVILFSTGWPFTKAALAFIEPFSFLAFEMSAAAIVATAVALRYGARQWNLKALFAFAALGVLSPGVNFALAIAGLNFTTASAASLIASVEPVVIVILAVALLGERLTPRAVALVLLANVGLLLIANPFAGLSQVTIGSAMVMLGVSAAAIYSVVLRFMPKLDDLTAVAAQMTGGAIALIAFSFFVNGAKTISSVAALPPVLLIATLLAGPLLDYAPYLLFTYASRFLSGATTGMAFNLAPLWAVVTSVLFLAERPSGIQIAGGAVVVAATVAYQRNSS